MNYQKIYNQLIEKAKIRNLTNRKETYFETHHIIPKCLGGKDTKKNKVNLTAREHFLAHWLLHRIFPTNSPISYAFFKMSNKNNGKRRKLTLSSRAYSESRSCIIVSKLTKNKQKKSRKKLFKNGYKNPLKGKKYRKEICKKCKNKYSINIISRCHGEKCSFEKRRCPNKKCKKYFFVSKKDKRKYCSKKCALICR